MFCIRKTTLQRNVSFSRRTWSNHSFNFRKKEDGIHIEMLEKKNVTVSLSRQNVNMLTEAAKKTRANDKI